MHARRSTPTQRAFYYGAIMAVIVFGGALWYLFDSRPRSYRAEGGDAWLFTHYTPAPAQEVPLQEALRAHLDGLGDAPGLWGAELLSRPGALVLLTRWRARTDAERAQQAGPFSPAPGLLAAPPTQELQVVEARK